LSRRDDGARLPETGPLCPELSERGDRFLSPDPPAFIDAFWDRLQRSRDLFCLLGCPESRTRRPFRFGLRPEGDSPRSCWCIVNTGGCRGGGGVPSGCLSVARISERRTGPSSRSSDISDTSEDSLSSGSTESASSGGWMTEFCSLIGSVRSCSLTLKPKLSALARPLQHIIRCVVPDVTTASRWREAGMGRKRAGIQSLAEGQSRGKRTKILPNRLPPGLRVDVTALVLRAGASAVLQSNHAQ